MSSSKSKATFDNFLRRYCANAFHKFASKQTSGHALEPDEKQPSDPIDLNINEYPWTYIEDSLAMLQSIYDPNRPSNEYLNELGMTRKDMGPSLLTSAQIADSMFYNVCKYLRHPRFSSAVMIFDQQAYVHHFKREEQEHRNVQRERYTEIVPYPKGCTFIDQGIMLPDGTVELVNVERFNADRSGVRMEFIGYLETKARDLRLPEDTELIFDWSTKGPLHMEAGCEPVRLTQLHFKGGEADFQAAAYRQFARVSKSNVLMRSDDSDWVAIQAYQHELYPEMHTILLRRNEWVHIPDLVKAIHRIEGCTPDVHWTAYRYLIAYTLCGNDYTAHHKRNVMYGIGPESIIYMVQFCFDKGIDYITHSVNVFRIFLRWLFTKFIRDAKHKKARTKVLQQIAAWNKRKRRKETDECFLEDPGEEAPLPGKPFTWDELRMDFLEHFNYPDPSRLLNGAVRLPLTLDMRVADNHILEYYNRLCFVICYWAKDMERFVQATRASNGTLDQNEVYYNRFLSPTEADGDPVDRRTSSQPVPPAS